MKSAGTYRITRQGQVTLPSQARESLELKEGDVVDMYYGGDMVIIKKKKEPIEVFEQLASKASARFSEKKLRKSEVEREIKAARRSQ